MQDYFYALADHLQSLLRGEEVYTCALAAEESTFVRLNRAKVRQAGSVTQRFAALELIRGRRHVRAEVGLSGHPDSDRRRLGRWIDHGREALSQVPEDPYLSYATEPHNTEHRDVNVLPEAGEVLEQILHAAGDTDLVGIYAAGGIHRGFANSLGQRNWHTRHSFHLDWSLYHHADKAVKCSYGGVEWNAGQLAAKMGRAREQLAVLGRPARTVPPERYRVYLTPAALGEVFDLLSWDGFGLRAQRTGTTPLLQMVERGERLHPGVTLLENTRDGLAPIFQSQGFVRPPVVTLVEAGRYRDCLVSPRSAAQYQVPTNGAEAAEAPHSLDMAPGGLREADVLDRLGTGIYVGNLWYLNYSDRNAGRITGMTRFGTFWVEEGAIRAPLAAMRFDETLYRMLGTQLVDLTQERDLIPDAATYSGRSTHSARLPGALVEDLTFTL